MTLCAIGINLASGMMMSWSVFAAAMVRDLGFTKTQTMIPYTMVLLVYSLFMIPGGWLHDRMSPRICITLGGIMAGGAFIIASFTYNSPVFGPSFGIIAGIGIAIIYAATTPTAVKWFSPQKRGLISGLVVAGSGGAALYVAPMTQYLVNHYGIKTTFWLEGCLYLTVLVVLAQFMAKPPVGYIPPGTTISGVEKNAVDERHYRPGEVLRTSQFWMIWLMFGCAAFAGLMIFGHMAIIAQVQVGISWGYVFVVFLAMFDVSGRILGGFLSDRLGRTRLLLLMFALQAVNMLVFKYFITSTVLLLGVAMAGFAYGSLLSSIPAITYDYFGMKNGGFNLGLLFTAYGLSSIAGPSTAARIVDLTGSYSNAYLVAASLLVFSMIIVRFIKKPTDVLETHG